MQVGPAATAIPIYVAAALAEIAGCFAFWAWWRLDRSAAWLAPGILALVAFAWLLTQVQIDFAGRAYAAYGGIYILASIIWLMLVEQQVPSRWDVLGVSFCLIGVLVILLGPLLLAR